MDGIPSVTVLISGRGSNLINLFNRARGYRIGAVVSNKRDAAGVAWARERAIPVTIVEREEYPSLSAFKDGVRDAVSATQPDLVALAGFMVVLPPTFIAAFQGRLVNIHPSLLPKFPGLDTHQRVIASGETQHGCTVHYVDAGVDTGAIIAQASLAVAPNDNPESLAERTLALEHELYPWVIGHLAGSEISLCNARVQYSSRVRQEAKERGFRLSNVSE